MHYAKKQDPSVSNSNGVLVGGVEKTALHQCVCVCDWDMCRGWFVRNQRVRREQDRIPSNIFFLLEIYNYVISRERCSACVCVCWSVWIDSWFDPPRTGAKKLKTRIAGLNKEMRKKRERESERVVGEGKKKREWEGGGSERSSATNNERPSIAKRVGVEGGGSGFCMKQATTTGYVRLCHQIRKVENASQYQKKTNIVLENQTKGFDLNN